MRDDSLKVPRSHSRYTLTPHEKKNGQEKSPKVKEESRGRKISARLALRSVLTQRVKPRATAAANKYVPRLNQNKPESVVIGSSSTSSSLNARKRQVESQQKPSRIYESYSINHAIAAGVPVIIAKDEAERRRVLGKTHHEDEGLMQGLAAKVSHPINCRGWQNGRDKGKGQPKQIKGDKGKEKSKQIKDDTRNGKAQQSKADKGEGEAEQAKENKGEGNTKQSQQERAKVNLGRRPISWFRKLPQQKESFRMEGEGSEDKREFSDKGSANSPVVDKNGRD